MHYVGIVQVRGRKDIRPTILVTIIGLLIKDSLVDSDIRIGPTSKVVVSKIGNLIYQKSATKVEMVDGKTLDARITCNTRLEYDELITIKEV